MWGRGGLRSLTELLISNIIFVCMRFAGKNASSQMHEPQPFRLISNGKSMTTCDPSFPGSTGVIFSLQSLSRWLTKSECQLII